MDILEDLAEHDEEPGALGRHSLLLGSLVVLLVALPLFEVVAEGGTRFEALLCLVLIAAVYVNSTNAWTLAAGVVVGGGAMLGLVHSEMTGEVTSRLAAEGMSLGLLTFTTLVMLNTLLRADHVSHDTVVGGVCVYLLIGLCFAMGFILITQLRPGALVLVGQAFEDVAADPNALPARILYYSFITLTTLGYGDITPVSELAQMMSAGEAIIGQLYLAIFLARLIALYVAHDRRRGGGGPFSGGWG